MSKMPCSIARDQTLLDAHRIMTEQHVRHLPVLEQGKLVGLLSQRDLYFLESVEGVDLATEQVSEAMSQDVFCAGHEAH
ncbi:MAG: CBS domain-containing protein, partial [Polyangiaceae bacterium]